MEKENNDSDSGDSDARSRSPTSAIVPSTPMMRRCPRIVKIASLNPFTFKWRIRGRVTQKNAIRYRTNQNGQFFSFVIADNSGEIRMICFKQYVDKYNDLIQLNRVIYVSQGRIQKANERYNNSKNIYEVNLGAFSEISVCEDQDVSNVPEMQFTFVKLADLVSHAPDSMVDICGVVHECGQCGTVNSKTGLDFERRNIGLVDTSGVLVGCTLWKDRAVQFDGEKGSVLVIKDVKVCEFSGRSLSVVTNSSLTKDPPDIPQCVALQSWYRNEGQCRNFDTFKRDGAGSVCVSTPNFRVISEINGTAFGIGDKPDFFSIVATVIYIKQDNCMYKACPKPDCHKKVIECSGGYRCEKCNLETCTYKWRLMLQINLVDFSGSQWVTCFQETGEMILGCTTEDLGRLKESNDENGFDKVFQSALFGTFNFRLRASMENYQDENRVRITVVSSKPLNLRDDCKRLITEMQLM